MKILSIESSCDETAVAIVEDGRKIIKNLVYSQIEMHKEFGGVVPELASRKHSEIIVELTKEALSDGVQIDAVAATCAPGLIGALLVGANFAKAMAMGLNVPFIPVHHIRGHIAANYIEYPDLKPPFMCLVASGGHSLIVKVNDYTDMEVIASTRDDAAGEAFDKVARVLDIGYPGGKIIDENAQNGNKSAYKFPRSKVKDCPLDFSFSGLKTAVINTIHNHSQKGENIDINDICASFNQAVVDTLVPRLMMATEQEGIKKLVCAGGVSANSMLREELKIECEKRGVKLYLPPLNLCSDNAAMIGAQAFYEYNDKNIGNMSQNCFGSLDISNNVSKMGG